MNIDMEKLAAVMRKVRVVRAHLHQVCHAPQEAVLRIMDLHWAIQDIYELEIEMLEVSFDGEHVRGNVERYSDKRARIFIRAHQPDDEKRLAAVKELSHIMIDEQDDWSTNGVETITGLLTETRLVAENGVGHENPTNPLQSETLAYAAAVELMYPYDYRDADIQKLDVSQTTIAKIALEHDVPPYAIEFALRNHATLKRCWDDINGD
jgi:Zn-dependent peptidase ImmA (M78 family)